MSPGAQRGERLEALLAEPGLDALLITDLVNLRYLSGYSGSNGLALVGRGRREFVTDFRYVTQAAEEVEPAFTRHRAPQELVEELPALLGSGAMRLGFEDQAVTVRQHERLRSLLAEEIELVPAGGLVERLRAVKDAEELERIRAACRLADRALEQVLEQGLVGRTERDVAIALETAMRELGAQRASFDSIVASGAHGALPHAQPRDVVIERDQLVVIDWGAELDGYCSDCTRTVATGEVGERAREVYAITRAAQLAGLEAVAAGRTGRAADGVAREVIAAAGYGESFGHGLGHGVGLEVHEAPRLAKSSTDTLEAGNVVSVEPGIYLPGEVGVRIEDLVAVTETGCEILTGLPKELRVVA